MSNKESMTDEETRQAMIDAARAYFGLDEMDEIHLYGDSINHIDAADFALDQTRQLRTELAEAIRQRDAAVEKLCCDAIECERTVEFAAVKKKLTEQRDAAVEALEWIQGWRETDLPDGDRAAMAIEYIETTAQEALAKIKGGPDVSKQK